MNASERREKRLAKKEEKRKAALAREEARRQRFGERCAALCARGFVLKDCTLKILSANVWGILTALPFAAGAAALFVAFAEPRLLLTGSPLIDLFFFVFCMAASLPVHEGLHALCWAAVSRSFAGIRFGFDSKTLTPYCASETPMRRAGYLFGCLAPFVILGAAPAAAAVLSGYLFLIAAGVVNILSAGGDLLVFFRTFACKKGSIFLDHPSLCGFYAFSLRGKPEALSERCEQPQTGEKQEKDET